MRRGVILATVLLLIAVVVVTVHPLTELAWHARELPQWDMAKYGVSGLRLAQDLQRLDLVGFAAHLHELSVWPPVFPLLETPFFLVLGPEQRVARLLVVTLFISSLVAAFECGRRLEGGGGGVGGLAVGGLAVGGLAVVALAASPYHQLFGTLVMLEIPGAFFQLLALGAYLRALAQGSERAWRWAAVAATLLFFCKYNYGLLWLVPVVLAEARRASGSWRELARSIVERLRRIDLRRPWTTFLLMALVGLLVLRLSGGFELEIAGQKVQATSLGSPVYVLYLLFLLRWLRRPRENAQRLRVWLSSLAPQGRSLVLAFVFPVGFWMLAPSHTKNFFNFLENRDSGLGFWSLESWLFYPRVFVEGFAPVPALGWLALVLAGVLVARLPWLDERRRVLALALVVTAVAAQLHPYKLPRFFFPVASLVWLAAAVVLVEGVRVLARRARGLSALLAPAACGLVLWAGVDLERLERGFAAHTVPSAVRPVADTLVETATSSPEVLLLGTWNLLSPPLVEWELRQRAPEAAGRLHFVRASDGVEGVEEQLEALAPGGLVVVIERTAQDDGFEAETSWLEPVRRTLPSDPRFERVWQRDFPTAGYRLEAYSRSFSTASPRGLSTPLVSSSSIAASYRASRWRSSLIPA